jgi:PAS domain S-box-containing protein
MFRFLLSSPQTPPVTIADELFEALPLGIVLQDTDLRIVAVNPAAVRILGMPEQELIGRTTFDPRFHAQRADGTPCPEDEHSALVALRTGEPVTGFVLGVSGADDHERWLRVTSVPVFSGSTRPRAVYSFFEDITETRRAARALAARVRQQQAVVELQRMALAGASPHELSQRACEMCADVLSAMSAAVIVPGPDKYLHFDAGVGWAADDAVTISVPTVPSESQAGYTLRINDVVVANDFAAENRFHPHSSIAGRARSGITAPIAGVDGPYGILGIHSQQPHHFSTDDVDFVRGIAGVLGAAARQTAAEAERRRTSTELQAAHALTTAVIESSGDSVYINDTEGRYLFANSTATANMGLAIAAAIGRTDEDLQAPAIAQQLAAKHREVLAGGERVVSEEEGSGPQAGRQFLVTRAPYRDPDGRIIGVITIARDITEQRRLAEHLRQTQKLEAIGRLAGGIAHDFNNLLTVVLAYADALAAPEELQEEVPGHIAEIKSAAERAALLTRQLLAFSRQQTLQPKVLEPNAIIANMDRMLRRIIGEDIQFETQLTPGAWNVKVDPGQLEQVLLNIVINARDAMPAGGRLRIETANVKVEAGAEREHREVRPGDYVLISVSDTGCGMTAETLAHAFEPFFTTKGTGGTGLGLATVYGVVKQSGGDVWASSEPNRGTCVRVYLPGVTHMSEAPAIEKSMRTEGAERVLVVEDERPVRELLARMLRRYGYTVTEAQDGVEAIERLQVDNGQYELVITDMVMPRMGGRNLAVEAAKLWPELRVLFMSGYAGHDAFASGVVVPGEFFLQKPFTGGELAVKVREVLDSPPRPRDHARI